MIDDRRMNTLEKLIEQADFLTYRPHLFAYENSFNTVKLGGWVCRYKTGVPDVYGYGLGSTMREAYESAREHWRAQERRLLDLNRRFTSLSIRNKNETLPSKLP
jgi:hypothetical protein